MSTTRRDIIRGFGLLGLAQALAAPVVVSGVGQTVAVDRVRYTWLGWSDQECTSVVYGTWVAHHRDYKGFVFATTLGEVGRADGVWFAARLARQEGWPVVRSESDELAEPVKERARLVLQSEIEARGIGAWLTKRTREKI